MIVAVAFVVAALAVPHAEPAYRLGSATNRVAVLPVRCERDLDPALCAALGESIAVEMGRDPRIDVVSPRDIDVLLGAQTVADLSTCDRDDCFARQDFTRIDASYLVAVAVSRIGDDAKIVVRVVDSKRGALIDRDEASAPRHDERRIETASKGLVMNVLVRRGLARPPDEMREERGLGAAFWVGLGAGLLGVAAAGTGAVLDVDAGTQTRTITDDVAAGALKDRNKFDALASTARTTAAAGDLCLSAAARSSSPAAC